MSFYTSGYIPKTSMEDLLDIKDINVLLQKRMSVIYKTDGLTVEIKK